MSDAIIFGNVDIVFGDRPEAALALIDKGSTRDEINEQTGLVLGVANASLSVNEGEILVLMGLSGSGKSTLLRAVNGLAPVVRGNVSVKTASGFVDPYRATAKALRDLRMHTVSMVFQQFGLLPWRNVADNVGFGLELSGTPEAERKRMVAEQLELVNLSAWADRKVGELSGGMQQRVGLARAFATGAPILLMDEPFSALDPLIRSRLQDELLEFQSRLKKTILFVSHDLDEAFRIGNRIAMMEGGRIIQCGTPQQIVKQPATQYVADFVQNMNPISMLTAADVMKPGVDEQNGRLNVAATARPTSPLIDILDALSKHSGAIGVVDNGAIIGTISADEIVTGLTRHRKK
ncbi:MULTISPECIES: choline ABC transporter ATP-binding protein [Rhizobium/Agrobacterium group]|jgi:glycine betaine/proline transport system ATP-binding protein|uniref:Choline ABC transporter ATP-binding protein n=2 Tax=Rhizobium/Agrobacterium group TaxID=227290 RepID=A0A1B9UUN1_AGRTU|nr:MULTISPECIES: choline ABC transporter ATP-binding protein [Rhizobium/Agrobacterium group]EHJ98732.1 proline/glycine/betaine ABC transporter nucleotide-binding protein/ATPase [Agrobacterium tumefaciens 5A]ADY65182.1 proline/glycine/betaine ABC transporter, nucleotide binding/ATPase protein [Agrobacterium tumefaciens]AYM11432.1 glycine betaine/proline transport system ATP-binding protein [Agrobacterium tumefaciens]KAA3505031.1 choline ABC transporter ATP-binding protein [Agrobacterium tumefaci